MKSLYIFRRDFRIVDNKAYDDCLKQSKMIIPIFIFTKGQVVSNSYKSSNAVQFMVESLEDLSQNLSLSLMYGKTNDTVIEEIIKKEKIDAIFANIDYTPFAVKRDKDLKILCDKHNVKLFLHHDILLQVPGSIVSKSTKKPFKKFTPFYNEMLKHTVDKPTKLKNKKTLKIKTKHSISFDKAKAFYKYNPKNNVKGGRKDALKILKNIGKWKNYAKTRDLLTDKTTHLSAYNKFGCVSIREVYWSIRKKLGLNHGLVRQLIWRDFYYHAFVAYQHKLGIPVKPQFNKLKWDNDPKKFSAWKNSKTGFPIVDAAMKQIKTTGYMHNRGRLIVASFLIKNLYIDWVKGAKYFAQTLLDYDNIVNDSNWQWVASTSYDSQPYFRIFNPWRQSVRFDKDAKYIKHWLPKLKDIPAKHLHQWDKYYKEYPSIKYPAPIVDYMKTKERTIAAYKATYK